MDLRAVTREYGREVEQRLERWPGLLGEAAADLLSLLAKDCPPSGEIWDYGAGDDGYPVFEALVGSFADVGLADERARRDIVEGFACTLLATAADEAVADAASPRRFCSLSHTLLVEAGQRFLARFPTGSAFWEVFRLAWQDRAEYVSWHQASHVEARHAYRGDDWPRVGRRWAPLGTGIAAAFCAGGRDSDLPDLGRLLDELHALFEIRRELVAIPSDIARGVHSLPIDRIQARLGDPEAAANRPEAILGALLLDKPLSGLIGECLDRLAPCRESCRRLGLASLEPVVERFRLAFESLDGLFSLRRTAPDPTGARDEEPGGGRSFTIGAGPGLAARIDAARACLLADPEFRESWEVHRWGLLGEARLTGRVFPSGLVLEALAGGGLALPDLVDALFSRWRRIDCRYFEEPCALPPDADSLGLMLRLLRFSSDPDAHRRLIGPALERMTANLAPDGDLPTYFTRQPPGEPLREYFSHIAGNHCTGVKAGLLIGLRECDDEACRAVAPRLQARLLEEVASSGSATNRYYPQGCWAWMMLRLLDRPATSSAPPAAEAGGSARVGEVVGRTVGRLERSAHLSAQQAAWLVLCRSTPAGWGDIRREWLRTIVSAQAQDGGWAAEPIYLVPTWDNRTAWHASRLITTAVCHLALLHCASRGMVP